MNYEKQKITVQRNRKLHPEIYDEVSAILVGGAEGVFATWREGDIVYLATGDDGYWWEIGSYHKHWIQDILCALGSVA